MTDDSHEGDKPTDDGRIVKPEQETVAVPLPLNLFEAVNREVAAPVSAEEYVTFAVRQQLLRDSGPHVRVEDGYGDGGRRTVMEVPVRVPVPSEVYREAERSLAAGYELAREQDREFDGTIDDYLEDRLDLRLNFELAGVE